MKKIKTAIILSLLGQSLLLSAQESNNTLEHRLSKLEEKARRYEDDYKREAEAMRLSVAETNLQLKKNTSEVEKLLKYRLETDENRMQRIESALHASSEFIKSSSKSFKAIDVSLVQTSLLQEITKLNNPTNNDLGFSLKEVITEQLDKYIVAKDKVLNKADRLNSFVSSILNNPITDIVKSAVPAINTVVSFVSNISFTSKKIDEQDFNAFTKGLNGYIKYYDGLATATTEFQSSLDQIKIQTKALEMMLENYAVDRVSDLYRERAKLTKPYDIDKLYGQFSKEQISAQIRTIRTVDNKDLLVQTLRDPRLNTPMTIATQARYIQDELEALTNQYINAHQSYLKSVIEVLHYSKSLPGADKEKIDKKMDTLKDQLSSWSVKFVSLVDVDDVKKQVREVNRQLSMQ